MAPDAPAVIPLPLRNGARRPAAPAVIAAPKRHIALVIYGLTGGGAQRRTLTLANGFAARGHKVDMVVVRGGCVLEDRLSLDVRLWTLDSAWPAWHPASLIRQRAFQIWAAVPGLARYLRDETPDITLSAASHINMLSVMAWRMAGRPMPLVLRASNHPYGNLHLRPVMQRLIKPPYNRLAGRLYGHADAVISVSDGVGDAVAELSGLPRGRITTIYNPVIAEEGPPPLSPEPPHPWLAPGEPPVVLAAGRLALQKDYPSLLRAFARLRAVRAARLVILGEGPERAKLEALARELGIAEDLLMPGYVHNAAQWMARAGVFVLSSLWEGLPGVLIEALSVGCPAVATDCPSGPAEILEKGRLGRLVPPRDAGALAQAIFATLEAPPARAPLIRRAEAFTIERGLSGYLEVLEHTLATAGRKAAPRPAPAIHAEEPGLDPLLAALAAQDPLACCRPLTPTVAASETELPPAVPLGEAGGLSRDGRR